jgi:hypothetical protein
VVIFTKLSGARFGISFFENPTKKPMTTPSAQNQSPQPPRISSRFAFEPMTTGKSAVLVIEALLKYPGRVIHELERNWRAALAGSLLIFALAGMAAYGIVVGSFSGGAQVWIAPTKLALGTLLSMLICLPSFYIFACLSGVEAGWRTVSGVLFAAVGLSALLLIGFAPVAWIFSQSTDSVAFMAALHLIFWAIGIRFGLRLVEAMGQLLSGSTRKHLKLWSLIFVTVCLQMATTLRPIVGRSEHFLPTEKKFCLAHWIETTCGTNQQKR